MTLFFSLSYLLSFSFFSGTEVENEGRGQPTALGLKVAQGKMVTSSFNGFSYHSSENIFVAGDCKRYVHTKTHHTPTQLTLFFFFKGAKLGGLGN